MNNISICNLKNEEDLEIIAEEYANYYNNSVSWEERWTRKTASDMFKFFYNQKPDLFFVAYYNEKPVGVIMALIKPWFDGMKISDVELFVANKYQNGGIGGKLLKKLLSYSIEKYDTKTLDTYTYEGENDFPYCWYKKLGFETLEHYKMISCNVNEIVNKL